MTDDNRTYRNCGMCFLNIHDTSQAVKIGGTSYHEQCFVCRLCTIPLSRRGFYTQTQGRIVDDLPYWMCSKCYRKNKMKCGGCKKTLGTSTDTVGAIGKHFHRNCLKCSTCRSVLEKGKYSYSEEEKEILCSACSKKMIKEVDQSSEDQCVVCHEPFETGRPPKIYAGKKFHVECFKCTRCTETIDDSNTVLQFNETLWCLKCHELHGPRCRECRQPLRPSDHVVGYSDYQFHQRCFKCVNCGAVIVEKSFFITEDQVCCNRCIWNN